MSPPEDPFELAERLALEATRDPSLIPSYTEATKTCQALEGAPGWKGRTKMTKTEKLIKHILVTGSVTQREAVIEYNIQSFHKEISRVRSAGFELINENRRNPITGQEYTRYSFASDADREKAQELMKVLKRN